MDMMYRMHNIQAYEIALCQVFVGLAKGEAMSCVSLYHESAADQIIDVSSQ